MSNSPLVSVIVWPVKLAANVIVSPAVAVAIAWRRLPDPLSLALVTVMLNRQRSSSGSKRSRDWNTAQDFPVAPPVARRLAMLPSEDGTIA